MIGLNIELAKVSIEERQEEVRLRNKPLLTMSNARTTGFWQSQSALDSLQEAIKLYRELIVSRRLRSTESLAQTDSLEVKRDWRSRI